MLVLVIVSSMILDIYTTSDLTHLQV